MCKKKRNFEPKNNVEQLGWGAKKKNRLMRLLSVKPVFCGM